MTPFYLRFPDEITASSTLGNWFPKEGCYASDVNWAIHTIGPIWTRDKEPVQIDGYHVNVLAEELPDELKPYVVVVTNPRYVFAGWD